MERVSRLEYGGAQRSSESSASDMDMDFNDVFGGPPRRFSIQEATRTRYSFNGSMESEEDSSDLSRSSWTGFSEKPVFGAENVVNRRRNQGGDFYDDIFKADESCSPGSRVNLTQKNEVFGTSLPVQFSLPAKLAKPSDLPLFASGSHTHKAKNDAPTFYRQSPLSREVTTIGDELKYMSGSDEQVIGENLKTNEENDHQFHFSIYKWAGKGVAILMPLRGGKGLKSKEEIKTELRSRSLLGDHLKISRDVNFHSFSTRSNISERSGSAYGVVEETETTSIPKSKSLENVNDATAVNGAKLTTEREAEEPQEIQIEIPTNSEETRKDEIKPLRAFLFNEDKEQGNVKMAQETEEKNDTVIVTEAAQVNVKVKKNVKKSDDGVDKNLKKRDAEVSNDMQKSNSETKRKGKKKTVVDSSPLRSTDNSTRAGMKGKVQDFVKMFNHEVPSTPQEGISRSKSFRWKPSSNSGVESEKSFDAPKAKEKVQLPSIIKMQDSQVKMSTTQTKDYSHQKAAPSVNESKRDDQKSKSKRDDNKTESKRDEQKAESRRDDWKPESKRDDKKAKSKRDDQKAELKQDDHKAESKRDDRRSESKRDDRKVSVGSIDDLFGANYVVEELFEDQVKASDTHSKSEDIQASDAKIRQWSQGRKGNIRSLLSTLQFVLWPESGWKPVALVDLLEGNAVKRSYQRALLYLHPDKLQQKGAASHQKYIAEKVFDILQEAWDHFNSLGSI